MNQVEGDSPIKHKGRGQECLLQMLRSYWLKLRAYG
jgi:hypothetical protein